MICTDEYYIEKVIALAESNVSVGGRPFACVIANPETGVILAEAANLVEQTGDPTAHPEAIEIYQRWETLNNNT